MLYNKCLNLQYLPCRISLLGQNKKCLFLVALWFEKGSVGQFFIFFISFFLYARLQTGRIIGDVRPSGSPSVRPSDSPSGSPSARFRHFSHTCFDILSWNFAHDFVLMYYRSSLSAVTLRQYLKELCLFVNLEYR